jgi:tetratricopeptide (TPR) repeat protein
MVRARRGLSGREARSWVIFAVALLVRLVYLLEISDNPYFEHPIVDCETYDKQAQTMLVEGLVGDEVFWQAPLYPYWLGFLYSLIGRRLLWVRVVQMVIGAWGVALVALLAERMLPGTGWWVGLMAAFYGTMIFFDGELLAPVLILPLTVLTALLVLRFAEAPTGRRVWGLGALIGLGALAHGPALLLLPALGAWILRDRSLALSAAGRRRQLAGLVLGTFLVIAPVTVRNALVGGELVLISSNVGINFYIGNSEHYETTSMLRPGTRWQLLGQEPQRRGIFAPGAQSRYFLRKAWGEIRRRPLRWLAVLGAKVRNLVNGNEQLRNQDIYPFRSYSLLLRVLLWKRGVALPFGVLLPLAAAGIALLDAAQRRRVRPILVMLGALALGPVLFFVVARYRLPLAPLLLPFAAWALRPAAWRGATPWRRGAAAAAILAVGVAANTGIGEMSTIYTADSYYNLGTIAHEEGDIAAAEEYYRKALAVDPDYVEAYNNLGLIIDKAHGDPQGAIPLYEEVLRRYPDQVDALINLGNAYHALGRTAEAVACYRRVLEVDPYNSDARHNLGVVLSRSEGGRVEAPGGRPPAAPPPVEGLLLEAGRREKQGDLEGARDVLRRALQADPVNPVAHHNLGVVLFKLGDLENAKQELEAALLLAPDLLDARNSLGVVLAAGGEFERARELFLQVLAERPGDPKASRNLQKLEGLTAEEAP